MARPEPNSIAVAAVLTAVVALGPLSTDMYLPSLPDLVRVFDTDVPSVQLTLSVYLVAFAFAMLIYGPLSDRFGRRPVMLGGLSLYVAASVACIYAGTIEELVVFRFFQAVGGCAGPVLGRAIVRDVWGPEKSATVLAYMGTAMAMAPAVAPVLGGFLHAWVGWWATFVVLAVFSGICLVLVYAMVGETNQHKNPDATSPRGLIVNYVDLLKHRTYIGYVLTISASYSVIFCFISGSSFVLIDIVGLSPDAYGLCFGTMVLGYMAGTAISGRIGQKVGLDRMVLIGGFIAAGAGLIMAAFAWANVVTVVTIVGPQVVAMLGVGFIFPNAQAGAIGPFPTKAGAASALVGFCQMGIASVVGIGIGHAFEGTARPMATGVAIAGTLALVFFVTLVMPVKRRTAAAAAAE